MTKLYDFNSTTFKLLRLFPGLITILLILLPVIASILGFQEFIAYYVLFLAIYWAIRTIRFLIGTHIGYSRYQKALKTNWPRKLEKAIKNWDLLPYPNQLPNSWDEFYLSIIIPMYKEPYEILDRTVKSIAENKFPLKEKVFLVFAIEERGGKQIQIDAQKIKEKYKKYFKDILIYVHPQGIPGEVIGIAGPNLKWASKHFLEEYIPKKKILPKNILMLKFDSDSALHPQFLSALTHKYLTTPDRYHAYFTNAVKLYSNNFWEVPTMMRLFSGLLTTVILSEWINNKPKKQCFSLYAFNADVLKRIGYWDPVIGVDDTGFFWVSFLYLNGKFRGEEFYLPNYSDAVDVGDYIKSHVAQYKQQVRWGGGAILAPVSLQGILNNPNIPLRKKLFATFVLFESNSFWTTATYFLSLAIPVMSLLTPNSTFYAYSHIVPEWVQTILGLTSVFIIPTEYFVYQLYKPFPKSYSLLKKIGFFFEFFLVIINMYVYNLIPYVKAQIDIMLGKFGKFYAVEKTVKT